MSFDLQHKLFESDDSGIQDESDVGYCYRLSAIVMHHGVKATGGHYTAFVRDNGMVTASSAGAAGAAGGGQEPNQQAAVWRHFDDDRVTIVSEETVLAATDSVYLLFYCSS